MDSLIGDFELGELNGVETPGVKSDASEDMELMNKRDASRFRRGAAKLN